MFNVYLICNIGVIVKQGNVEYTLNCFTGLSTISVDGHQVSKSKAY